jgi:predicted PurR-regulated permease PerM
MRLQTKGFAGATRHRRWGVNRENKDMPDTTPPSGPRWAQVVPAETPSLRGLTTLAVSVVVVAALYFGREVLVPITLAILLSFVLAPLADLIRRTRIGRVPAVILSVLIALGVIAALAGIIGMQIAELADDIPRYQTTIRQKADAVRDFTTRRLSDLIGNVGREFQRATKNDDHEAQGTPGAAPAMQNQGPAPLPVEVRQPAPSPIEFAERIISPALNPIATAAIIFIVAIFILLQQEDLRDRLIRLFGSRDLHRTTVAMDDAARRLSRYFLTQLGINASFGVIIGVGLFFIGIPSPLLWGVLAALLRFVPYVGALMAGVIPVALGASVDPGWSMMIWAAALFLVTEPIMGQIVEPMLYGRSTGLSPVSVVVSAIFWAWIWGPIGLILATPLTLCLVVLGRHVERLEFLDVILGDRPALTPVENFYQRVLAGDPDEALEQAELLLKERSLSSYYDEVALKGLQLAATDVLRGVVTPLQLDCIRDAVNDLIEGLDEHPDTDPGSSETEKDIVSASGAEQRLPKQSAPDLPLPPEHERAPEWRSSAPVMCIGGRGPLDEAAAGMLAQLLQKHALSARVVTRDAVSRAGIASFDTQGVAMVCILYLEIAGTPSQLRYLVRRIRWRLPQAPILVGLWPPGDNILGDQARQRSIGADYYVTSLRDAITMCLRTAQSASDAVPPVTAGAVTLGQTAR